MSYDTYEVILEKKGRGKGFSFTRPWTIRTFKLKGQTLQYWDRDVMKGTIDIKGSASGPISTAEADGREFGFAVNTSTEKLILNASSSALREQCIERFNIAANDPNWANRRAPAVAEKEQKEYEAAAKAAVTAALAEEAEKARLKKELEENEKKMKVEVSAETAGVFQEALADKALEDARKAEAEQQLQQQQEVAALMGTANAKKRFREALAKGHMGVARTAAANMLQGAWRAKVSRRQVAKKRAEKKRLLEDGYARKIQSRYRSRLARRKVARLKEEKRQIKLRLCALRIQSRWRIFMARKMYKRKQEAKLQAEFSRSVNRTRGLITLQTVVRAFLAKRRISKVRILHPSVVSASVLKAEGLPGITDNSSVGAIFSGVTLDVAGDHPFLHKHHVPIPDDFIRAAHRVTSNFKVDDITGAHSGYITGSRRLDFVVVTLFDRSSSSKDEFLGQIVVRYSDLQRQLRQQQQQAQQLPAHQAHQLPRTASGIAAHNATSSIVELSVPLASKLLVQLPDGGSGQLVTVRKAGGGNITVAFNLLDPKLSIAGPLFKVSESMLSNAWKRRWFILANGTLMYFNSEFALENSKNVVIMKNATALKKETYKGREGWKLSFTTGADNKESFWLLDFDDSIVPLVRRMWLQRFYANAPAIPDPSMSRFADKLNRLKLASATAAAQGGEEDGSNNGPHTPAGKTRTPMSKRLSVFS